jgi:D-hydroxyproline dehydrogenase subunit alpha
MAKRIDLLVVGGGPAGLEAALAAAEAGVDVALVDVYKQLGGEYFKQLSAHMRSNDGTVRQKQAQDLFRRFKAASLQTYADTIVWNAEGVPASDEWHLHLNGPGAPETILAKTLVVAAGVYDRSVPFPGWTLPGVVTAGGVQIMLKTQRILPGKRVLLSGTGPLQIAVAAQLIHAGAEVVGVFEANRIGIGNLKHAPALWGQWTKMSEGFDYWRTLRKAGVKVQSGFAAIAAKGSTEVEQVVVARLDQKMRPLPGTEQTVDVDTLIIGYGFLPSNELTRLLQCDHVYIPEQMYHVPRHNEKMQTSIPSVFVAGDGAGVGGAALARIQGRIAGAAVANKLGKMGQVSLNGVLKSEHKALKRELRFAEMFKKVFPVRTGLLSWADDDTLICRCEEVSKKEIIDSVEMGCDTLIWAKRMTRAGMGMCQGRVCGQWTARLIAQQTGKDPSKLALDTVRPPIRPISLNFPEAP